jgi:hypothetical protein
MKTRILLTLVIAVPLFMVGRAQAQSPPPSLADIKMLAKQGVSEEVILSQIRNSHAFYHLSTADILDLKDSGVSERVIDFMINTASSTPPMVHAPVVSSAPQEVVVGAEPPPPIVEQVTVAPGPEYVWVSGYWRWHHHSWEWIRGHWAFPPRRGAIWVEGHWDHRGDRIIWIDAYWR